MQDFQQENPALLDEDSEEEAHIKSLIQKGTMGNSTLIEEEV
jgi:hypothetical protein